MALGGPTYAAAGAIVAAVVAAQALSNVVAPDDSWYFPSASLADQVTFVLLFAAFWGILPVIHSRLIQCASHILHRACSIIFSGRAHLHAAIQPFGVLRLEFAGDLQWQTRTLAGGLQSEEKKMAMTIEEMPKFKLRSQSNAASDVNLALSVNGNPNPGVAKHQDSDDLMRCWKSAGSQCEFVFEKALRTQSVEQANLDRLENRLTRDANLAFAVSGDPNPGDTAQQANDDLMRFWKPSEIASAILEFEASGIKSCELVNPDTPATSHVLNGCGRAVPFGNRHSADALSKRWKSDDIAKVVTALEDMCENITDAAGLNTALHAFQKGIVKGM